MVDFTSNMCMLSRLLFVFEVIGESFLAVSQFSNVVRLFITNEGSKDGSLDACEKGLVDDDERQLNIQFGSEVKSFAFLNRFAVGNLKDKFVDFCNFSISHGVPLGGVFMSARKVCGRCNAALALEKKSHVVVVYHMEHGTYLGSRMTKVCRKCKVYEHYGYWTEKSQRFYDAEFLELDFFLSSEETAFEMSLLQQYAALLVVGALPFSTFAEAYNRRFNYSTEEKTPFKRKRRYVFNSTI